MMNRVIQVKKPEVEVNNLNDIFGNKHIIHNVSFFINGEISKKIIIIIYNFYPFVYKKEDNANH
jgi:hypothetical protein